MKILLASAECVPFAKTGGLADVCGALPKSLQIQKQNVVIIMPRYKKIDEKKYGLKTVVTRLDIPLGGRVETCAVKSAKYKGLLFWFVENEKYFDRDELYRTADGDYEDNGERFTFFSRAVLEVTKALNFQPDIIHCHDWQTGLIPAYLKTLYQHDGFFYKTRTVYTIHNLAYQGFYPKGILPFAGFGWEEFAPEKMEYWGGINFMKAGIVYADIVNTVSPNYALEIQSEEYFGRGLDGILRARSADLYGILNGLDYDDWNPEKDKFISINYTTKSLEKKKLLKNLLQKKTGLKISPQSLLIGSVSRLDPQKGFDIIRDIFEEVMQLEVQFVLLGLGDKEYLDWYGEAGKKYPGRCSVNFAFDNPLSHLIYAASDCFLMPSRFEPCGLGQLISFKYGTLPIVHKTGGLADTVVPYQENETKASGFAFTEYTPSALLEEIKLALNVYQNTPLVWKRMRDRVAKLNFSWAQSARKYIELYKKAVNK